MLTSFDRKEEEVEEGREHSLKALTSKDLLPSVWSHFLDYMLLQISYQMGNPSVEESIVMFNALMGHLIPLNPTFESCYSDPQAFYTWGGSFHSKMIIELILSWKLTLKVLTS